jgi:hypothetical protein
MVEPCAGLRRIEPTAHIDIRAARPHPGQTGILRFRPDHPGNDNPAQAANSIYVLSEDLSWWPPRH